MPFFPFFAGFLAAHLLHDSIAWIAGAQPSGLGNPWLIATEAILLVGAIHCSRMPDGNDDRASRPTHATEQ